MAQFKITTQKIVKTIEVDEKLYSLELTQPELKSLILVLGCIGGSPDNTPRKYIDSIDSAIGPLIKNSFDLSSNYPDGTIDFKISHMAYVDDPQL